MVRLPVSGNPRAQIHFYLIEIDVVARESLSRAEPGCELAVVQRLIICGPVKIDNVAREVGDEQRYTALANEIV